MATNKKPRKKYIPFIKTSWQRNFVKHNSNYLFGSVCFFFENLKKGKCSVFCFDEGELPEIYWDGEHFAAYKHLQVFCAFVCEVFKQKNISIDLSPIFNFIKYLNERKDNLYFDITEINKAYAVILKIKNIFFNEIAHNHISKGVVNLEKNIDKLKENTEFYNG